MIRIKNVDSLFFIEILIIIRAYFLKGGEAKIEKSLNIGM